MPEREMEEAAKKQAREEWMRRFREVQKRECQIFCVNLVFPFKPASPIDLQGRSSAASIS